MKTMNKAAATILSIGVIGAASFASDQAQAGLTCAAGSCNNFGYILTSITGGSSCSTGCSEPQYHSSIAWNMAFGGWYTGFQSTSYTYTPFSGFPNGFGYSYELSTFCPNTGWNNSNFPGPFYSTTGPQYAFCPGFATGTWGYTQVTAISP
jgi:hypothetical protein